MQIKTLKMENFLSYESAELNLSDRGLVLVEGENRDSGGSNGAGKSAIFEAICWCLFGYTNRGLKANDVCRLGSTGTRVEVSVTSGDGQEYTVIRNRNHKTEGNRLVWKHGETDLSLGSDRETQGRINGLLQLDADSFNSVVLFPQGASGFASLTDGEQKAILDKVLGMQRFSDAHARANSAHSDVEKKLGVLGATVAQLEKSIAEKREWLEDHKRNLANFDAERQADLDKAKEAHKAFTESVPLWDGELTVEKEQLEQQLLHPDLASSKANVQKTQTIITSLNVEISKLGVSVSYLEKEVAKAPKEEPEMSALPPDILKRELLQIKANKMSALKCRKTCSDEIIRVGDLIEKKNSTTSCETCGQTLTDNAKVRMFGSYEAKLEELQNEIDVHESDILKLAEEEKLKESEIKWAEEYELWKSAQPAKVKLEKEQNDILLKTNALRDLQKDYVRFQANSNKVDEIQAKLNEIKSARDRHTVAYAKWEHDCILAHSKISEIENRKEPYSDQMANLIQNILAAKKYLASKVVIADAFHNELRQLKFWLSGFGNAGVKSLLLDTVTPFLTQRANEYLEIMTDGTAKVSFDTQKTLKSGEARDKFGVSVGYTCGADSYRGISGGERRRADIAVLFALGDLAASRSIAPIDLRLLDEPFEALDSVGAELVVRLLQEKILPQSKTVLVMSHDDSLKSLFNNRITVVKENGISRIE